VQTPPWLVRVSFDSELDFSVLLALRNLATGDDRHMSNYNGVTEHWTGRDSGSLASQVPYEIMAISGPNVDRHNGKHGGRGALRGRTLWHKVTGLMVGISRNVSIVETNVVGYSQYIKTSLNMIPK
jgi:hypothetical protein